MEARRTGIALAVATVAVAALAVAVSGISNCSDAPACADGFPKPPQPIAITTSRTVAASAVRPAFSQLGAEADPALRPEVMPLLWDALERGTPAMRARARKLLKKYGL